MRRKILMGVLALALPIGTVASLQTAAVAKPLPNPITCTGLSGTVVFPTPESISGTVTTAKKSADTTVTGTSVTGCTDNATHAAVSVTLTGLSITGGKNAKNPTKTSPKTYLAGQWSAFVSAGLGLKKSLKTVSFSIGTFKTSGSSVDNCIPGQIGFAIAGTVSGTYATAKKAAVINACLGTDRRVNGSTGNFGADLLSTNGPTAVVSAQIMPATSNATL